MDNNNFDNNQNNPATNLNNNQSPQPMPQTNSSSSKPIPQPNSQPQQVVVPNSVNQQPIYQQNTNQQVYGQQQPPQNAQYQQGQPNFGGANLNQQQDDPGKVLAIISIVMAFIIPLVGFILALVAKSKSKKAGIKSKLVTIGILLNIAMFLLSFIPLTLYILFVAYGNASASATANNFIQDVRNKDYVAATKLTTSDNQNDASMQKYLESLTASVGSSQKKIKSDKQNNKRGYVYEIIGGTSKYIRIVVQDGKVIDATVSNNMLGIFGGNVGTLSGSKENDQQIANIVAGRKLTNLVWTSPSINVAKWATYSSNTDIQQGTRLYRLVGTSCGVIMEQPAGLSKNGIYTSSQVANDYASKYIDAIKGVKSTTSTIKPILTKVSDAQFPFYTNNSAKGFVGFSTYNIYYAPTNTTGVISAYAKDDFALVAFGACSGADTKTYLDSTVLPFIRSWQALITY